MEKLDKQLFEKEIQFLESKGFKYREDLAINEDGFTDHVFIDDEANCVTFTNPLEDGDTIGWGLGQMLFNGKPDIGESGCDSVEHFHEILEEIFEKYGV